MPSSPKVFVALEESSGKIGAPQWVDKIIKTDEEWAKQLTRSQYVITRAKGTERPFCGTLLDNKKEGIYMC